MKKVIAFFILVALHGNFNRVLSQNFCYTTNAASDLLQQIPKNEFIEASNNYVVRVFAHIMRRTDGAGGQTIQEVNTALAILVADFESKGICISLLGIDEIHDDIYYYYDQLDFFPDTDNDGKFDNFSPNSHSNAVDLYLFANDAYLTGGVAANIGATALAIGGNRFGVNLVSSHVISHELGHCLGLFHTFHGLCQTGPGSCPELPNGSNCSTCGDYVCDTPADPQTNQDDSQCNWTGTTCGIGSGSGYNPSMNLIMAYIKPTCMQLFTQGQGERMRSYLANYSILQSVIVPNSLILSNVVVVPGENKLYDVLNDITLQSRSTVHPNGALVVRAGDLIKLKTDFHAKNLSSFHAVLDQTCSTIGQNNSARQSLINTTNSSKIIQKNNQLSINNNSKLEIDIYPNPVNNKINIHIILARSGVINIKLFSVTGENILASKTQFYFSNKQLIQLDVSELPNGIYFIQVFDGTNTITKKILKAS